MLNDGDHNNNDDQRYLSWRTAFVNLYAKTLNARIGSSSQYLVHRACFLRAHYYIDMGSLFPYLYSIEFYWYCHFEYLWTTLKTLQLGTLYIIYYKMIWKDLWFISALINTESFLRFCWAAEILFLSSFWKSILRVLIGFSYCQNFQIKIDSKFDFEGWWSLLRAKTG